MTRSLKVESCLQRLATKRGLRHKCSNQGNNMWTWAFSFASLAFILQTVVGLPSFGTGNQVEEWNEVDNEHPGEIFPPDYMMPMKDPREITGGQSPMNPIGKLSEQRLHPTPEELPAPNPTPRPPTVQTNYQMDQPSDSSPSERPVKEEIHGEKSDNNVPRPPTTQLPENKIKQNSASNNQRTSTEQVPGEKNVNHGDATTTPKPLDEENTKISAEKRPLLVLKIRRLTEPVPEKTDEVECDCEECAAEAAQSGNGNEDETCNEEDNPPQPKSEDSKINEAVGSSPLSLLRVGRKDENLEDIFRDVSSILRAMPQSDKRSLLQSIPFTREEEKKMDNNGDSKNVPKILARIVMRVSTNTKHSDEDVPSTLSVPCNMDDGSQENPSQEQNPLEKFSQLGQNGQEVKLPNVNGVLLKSLLPREYFLMKDLFNIMKVKKMANADEEQKLDELKSFDPFEVKAKNTLPRFVAVINKGPREQLPPLYFPYEQARHMPKSVYPDFEPLMRPQIPADNIVRQFLGGWSPPRKVRPANPFEFNPFKSPMEYNDHMRNFDPQISDVMNLLVTKLANQESAALKNIRLPSQDRPMPEEEGEDGNFHVGRQKLVMSFNK